MLNIEQFEDRMNTKGWIIFDNYLDPSFVNELIHDLEAAYKVCRDIQLKNGIAAETEGTVHHLIGMGDSFFEFLDRLEPLIPYLELYFQGKFILNSFGGNILLAGKSYANNIHRDIRSFSGNLPLMLNMMVMLDDFTAENGATYLMGGSHVSWPEKPPEEIFYKQAERAIGPAGSIVLFNSNLWHAAGENKTNRPRRLLTPMFSKPFMKQQCDYPRIVGYEKGENLSELRRQLVGFNSRVPASLEEWYQPPQNRMYRPGQG
jgi:ectoine hydroxylase-related dioxygenase (phytanoyl-CoA dioxygenase family)